MKQTLIGALVLGLGLGLIALVIYFLIMQPTLFFTGYLILFFVAASHTLGEAIGGDK